MFFQEKNWICVCEFHFLIPRPLLGTLRAVNLPDYNIAMNRVNSFLPEWEARFLMCKMPHSL